MINKETRNKVYMKYLGRCAYCGKEIAYKDMQVDHLIPLNGYKEQGTDDFDNLMPSCRRCNHYKRANTIEGFRKLIEEIPSKLMRDNYIFKVGVDYGFFEPRNRKVQFYYEKNEHFRRMEKNKIDSKVNYDPS